MEYTDEITGNRDQNNGIVTLFRNNIGLYCSYKNPVVLTPGTTHAPGALVLQARIEPQMFQPQCNSLCPLFEIHADKTITLNCGMKNETSFKIVNDPPTAEPMGWAL